MPVFQETKENKIAFLKAQRNPRTITRSISETGVGLFTAENVAVTFHPAPTQTGICFKRVDLDGVNTLSATTDNLKATPRCTILGNESFQIVCVEHVLSAIASAGIDNMIIEISGGEVPIFDGSALKFIEMLDAAGITEQEGAVEEFFLQEPIYLCDRDMQIVALPSDQIKYSYTLAYPGLSLLDAQFYCFNTGISAYKDEIASARTFSPLSEVKVLIEKKILKSDSLDHGLVIDGDKVLNPLGLRFSNEMARHKVLDMIGDLALTGSRVVAHFIAIKSGHNLNTQLAAKLRTMIGENR